jgi:hypothetical protein
VRIDGVSEIEPDKAKVLLSSLLSEPTHIFGSSEETKKAEDLYNNIKCLRISDQNQGPMLELWVPTSSLPEGIKVSDVIRV